MNYLISHNGILYGSKTERTIAIPNNMDESHGHQAECKKLGRREYILYDFIYLKCTRQKLRKGGKS